MATVTADFGLPVAVGTGTALRDFSLPIAWTLAQAGAAMPIESGALNEGSPVRFAWSATTRAEALAPIDEQTLIVEHVSTIFGEWYLSAYGASFPLEWGAESEGMLVPFEWGRFRQANLPILAEERAIARNTSIAPLPLEAIGAVGIVADAVLPFAAVGDFSIDVGAPAGWLQTALVRGALVEGQLGALVDFALPDAFSGRLILTVDRPVSLGLLAGAAYTVRAAIGWNQLARSVVTRDSLLQLEWIVGAEQLVIPLAGIEFGRRALADAALRAAWLADLARHLDLPASAIAALRRGSPLDAEYIGAAALVVDRLILLETGGSAEGLPIPFEFGTAPSGLGFLLEILAPPRLLPPPPGAVLLDRTLKRK